MDATLKPNSQLDVAVHTLGHIAARGGEALSSEHLARCAGTNPVVVRRVLGVLREAGIVSSARGRAGGWTLSRDPASVNLADIHDALAPPRETASDPHACGIAGRLRDRFAEALARADISMRRELERTTLADLI